MECEVCRSTEDAPLRRCDSCRRQYHYGLCGGIYHRSETVISDFDPDDYMRGQTAARSSRRHEEAKRLCIICRANDFGQHGVPPGTQQWQKALAAYDLNRVAIQRRYQPDGWQHQFEERENIWNEMQAARKQHFAPLEPMKALERAARASLDDFEHSVQEARENRSSFLIGIVIGSDKLAAAIEDQDQLAARWLESRRERSFESRSIRFSRMQEALAAYLTALSTCEQIGSYVLECLKTYSEFEERILRFDSQTDVTQVELQRIRDSLREAEEALEITWNEIRAASPDWKVFQYTEYL